MSVYDSNNPKYLISVLTTSLYLQLTYIVAPAGISNIPISSHSSLQKKKRELRKLAKQQKRKFKVVWNEYLDEQAKLAEEKKKQEEANKPKVETTEDLLKDIRALLIAQQNSPKVAETLDKIPAQAEEPVKAE